MTLQVSKSDLIVRIEKLQGILDKYGYPIPYYILEGALKAANLYLLREEEDQSWRGKKR